VPSAADVTGKDPDKASNAFLMVLPFVTLANDSMEDRLAAGLVEAIVTDLAKLSGLSIMAHASLMNLDSQSADLDALRRKYGSTHALRGSLEREGDLLGGGGPHMDILRASTYAELKQEKKARSIIRDLIQSYPKFPFQSWLARWVQSSDDLSRLMGNLYRLGLPKEKYKWFHHDQGNM